MAMQLWQTAPDFVKESTHGTIQFHDWLVQSWGVLFSYPKDFAPVSITELGEVARAKSEWGRRNVKVIGLSVDPIETHLKRDADIHETQDERMHFPVLGDSDRAVAGLYCMIHDDADPNATVRSVFVIGPAKKIRLILTYPRSTGRGFVKLLRAIDSRQLTDARRIATPADWTSGNKVVISSKLSDEEARRMFPQGFDTLKSYLRLVDLNETPS